MSAIGSCHDRVFPKSLLFQKDIDPTSSRTASNQLVKFIVVAPVLMKSPLLPQKCITEYLRHYGGILKKV